jgi:pimeloyl-ACP methyl ester carboxylesterase
MIPALAAQGITAHTLDLPGHGLRNGETQTLAAYAGAVAAKLQELPEPAALLGHSMGGQVIAAAAERAPERIIRLIHLCAFLPRNGESILDQAAGDDESILGGFMQPQDDGTFLVADEGIRPTFYEDCSDEDVALATLLLVPQAGEPFQTAIALSERSAAIPRAYILCARDKALGLKKQREWVDRAGNVKTVTLNTSHSPFFSAPADLAAAIKELA